MKLEQIVSDAVKIRDRHFKEGRPMHKNSGFKEANIAHDVSCIFSAAGLLGLSRVSVYEGLD
jgi:hypothetical protein